MRDSYDSEGYHCLIIAILMGVNAVYSLLAAVAVTVLCGLTYGYWMGAAFTGVSTGLLCFALLQFCAHLVQKNRKKLDDEPEEK